MWNDTDVPIGFLITFRTYGTWLHGDARGSTDRCHHMYNSPHIPRNDRWRVHNQRQLVSTPLILNPTQRDTVASALREVCDHRGWTLHALNARTNHIHAVVSIGPIKPERALNAFKTYSTRRLREKGQWVKPHSPWADKGSNRYLWTERSLGLAIDYVLYGQDDVPPDLD